MSIYKSRQHEIATLKLKYKKDKYKRPFPDLSTPQNVAPLSNAITHTERSPRSHEHPDAQYFPVGHSHKQGLELITPGTDLKWMGGRKS